MESFGGVEEIGSFGKIIKVNNRIDINTRTHNWHEKISNFYRKNYRKDGDGNPWAGHKIENAPPLLAMIGLVSIEDNFGGVDEMGSKLNFIWLQFWIEFCNWILLSSELWNYQQFYECSYL